MAGGGKLYLQMVYAKATYMGCGIIGYTEYAYHDNNANLIYNVSFDFLITLSSILASFIDRKDLYLLVPNTQHLPTKLLSAKS